MRIRDWSSDVCSSDLNLSIPADPDELRQATSIILVALVHANGQGRVGVTRIDADHGQTGALEFMPEPTRHGARRSEERRVGKGVSVRVDLGGRRIINKKNTQAHTSRHDHNITR